ncbi:ATP-binding protein [Stakelama marina]|uniref:histidine kinase n=1 Tax=Stakelama marina TaxID=2826939 RepID=A0A8T4IH52_9SPHN|nr:ATP-binding protein [Stakelama marina]MBR0553963.1 ATPase [Stakelama marina]
MEHFFEPRTLIAILLVACCAAIGLVMGADIDAMLIVLVGGVAAVLMASGTGEPHAGDAEPGAERRHYNEPGLMDVLEAVGEPLLVVADNRVWRANKAAHALLGQHIVGEDVRLAIRHPAAAERLLSDAGRASGEPINLIGLGRRDQSWEMRVRAVGDGIRIVHLVDRTGSYATERIRVDFVANASHELRTPLASLLGFIETLGEEAGEDPETRARFLKVMFDEAVRMQRLVDDLMSLSRIEAEKYREPADSVDLGALAQEVCAELSASGDPRATDLSCAIDSGILVRGDRAQLSQLLHNIVGNAMKYGRAGTPVTIALHEADRAMAALSVSDEGEGIAPEHLPRLTERFYRVDPGRSRKIGGTGLGLAIVKHIVERHRGRLDISSVPGKGTTVRILLPQAPLSSTRNENATEAGAESSIRLTDSKITVTEGKTQ